MCPPGRPCLGIYQGTSAATSSSWHVITMEAHESMTKHDEQIALKLWGVRETARYLGIPASTLYQWRAKGYGPPGRRIGRYVKYLPEEVHNWVHDQPEGGV